MNTSKGEGCQDMNSVQQVIAKENIRIIQTTFIAVKVSKIAWVCLQFGILKTCSWNW